MIKRDILQRLVPVQEDDKMGGGAVEYDMMEKVPAHVSVVATAGDITQFGIKDQLVLHTATDFALDDVTPDVRYQYSGRVFQMLRQQKVGNEYLQTFEEVSN